MKKSKKVILSTVVATTSIALITPLVLNANSNESTTNNELEANGNEWQPERKDLTLEIDNYKTYPLANDKYIVVAKKDRVLVYALSGDLLFTLTTSFLTGALNSQTNEITRIVLEDSKLYILSSFVDSYNNPVNTAFSVFDLANAKILVSQYISLRKNVVNNIMELSPNEFLLTSSFNNVTETLANSDNLVFNKENLTFSTKKFPKAVVNLDKDALLLDLVKVNVENRDFLVGLVTAKTRGPAITYFSYDSELNDQNPGNYTDYEAVALRNELSSEPLPVTSNAFEKNQANQKFVSPVFYNFQKFIIKSNDNTHILFSFANKEKNNRLGGESLSGNISRNFLIFDTKNFVPNVSNGRGIAEKESYGEGENKTIDFKNTNYTMARNLKINDGAAARQGRNSGLNFPLDVKTALNLEENSNEGLVKASLSYAIKDNKIFSSFLTPSKKLQPAVANKIFSTTFMPNTLLTMSENSYINVQNQFEQGQLVALPTKNGLVRINDHYEDLIGLRLDANNENITHTSKINIANKSVSFSDFNEDKNRLASVVAQSVNVDNFISAQNNTTINRKEWIFDDKTGTLTLKANITTSVWYQDNPDTFDIYHVYEGFKKEKDYVPVFAKDNSVALNENKLKNKAYSFKNQYAANVTLSELTENLILIPPQAFEELTSENVTLTPNNEEGTLSVTINENLLPNTLRDSLRSKLTTKYTGFKKQINSNFYWKFNAPELSTYRSKKASELTIEQAKTLMSISGYDLNSGVVELQPNDALGIVNIIAKYTNLSNNRLTTFEAEFTNFKLPEVTQNENDAVISVRNANNIMIENDNNNFELSFNLTNANAKYVQVEIIPWSTANNAPIANSQIIKSNIVLNNDNQNTTVIFSDLNKNFKDYKLLNVKFFETQSSTSSLSEPNFRIPDPQIILHLPRPAVIESDFSVSESNKSLKRTSDGFKLNFNLNNAIDNKFIKIELSQLDDDGVNLVQPEIKINSGYVPSNTSHFVFENMVFDKKYKITKVGVYDEENSLIESETARINLNNQTIILTSPSPNDPIDTNNQTSPNNPEDNNQPIESNQPTDNQNNNNESLNPNNNSESSNQDNPQTNPENSNNSSNEKPNEDNKEINNGSNNQDNNSQDQQGNNDSTNNSKDQNNNQNDKANNKHPKDWITAAVVLPVLFISLIIALAIYIKNKLDRKKLK